ncbi:adenylate/guanylate cyclase [Rhodopseudomonas palustris HaA2]|uniref:Adenylate/guanylate cyclase n=1 Tax=Rhodopseudomonas palustris (strain HaA2) TaxID=316058 RepID=Q2J1Q8_RHOP2|nr:adenylate/guanylate cyclase domain-containing protein [Rhodopseudomonas palustris]ABD05602.1 adenylate/guanylate cyclase [Rhodopseudomonas palustris HaA2]
MPGLETIPRTRRRGLFAKYVTSLVGLVVFVLAVNGALEIWFSYRQTRTALIDAMAEKAEASARRIAQAMTELERQISWTTRASVQTLEQRRTDYTQLMQQVPAISQLALIDGQGREALRLTRSTGPGGGEEFWRDPQVARAAETGVSIGQTRFRNGRPFIVVAVAHAGRDPAITVAEIDLRFLSELVGDAQAGKVGIAYVIDPAGRLLASSRDSDTLGDDIASRRQVAALLRDPPQALASGQDGDGNAMLVASRPVAKLGWFVLFEQPRSQAFASIGEVLLRIAGLIALGLIVAIIASMLLARRMLVPIDALRAGASRLGGGDFGQRIEVRTGDELEELSDQFNSMAGQLRETYAGLESKVEERTRDLERSINELKALEEVGRAIASSLDLDAVLPTVAARALEITRADAVLIFSYDPLQRRFDLAEAKGIDPPTDGGVAYASIDADGSVLGDAAQSGQPIAVPDLSAAPDHPLKALALAAGFASVLVVPLLDQHGALGALVVLRRSAGDFADNLIGLMRTFAHQSELAMRNARLFREVDHKGRELASAHDTVQLQAAQLREQTDQLKDWNRSLEERVEKQLGEIERIRRLERFLAPQVAQLIASSDGHDALLDSHRREVTVVFCDLRGFTAFTEASEPEEAMNVLREYHAALGELIFRYEGTLDRFAGDGVMILFNAPIPFADHTRRAVKMAVEMRDALATLTEKWSHRGHSLGFGIGIAVGYATIGQVGFEHRLEYAAIGSVTNLASRLCAEAAPGQIIVSQRAYAMVEDWAEAQPIEPLTLKGFSRPIPAVEILRWRETSDAAADTHETRPAASAGRAS